MDTLDVKELILKLNKRQPLKWKKIPKKMRFIRYFGNYFFFGNATVDGRQVCVGKPANEDGHILVVEGTGCGKSSCIAIPALREWPGTFLAIDIKGELLRETASYASHKHPIKVFSFSQDSKYSRYDPFDLLRNGGEDNLVQNIRELAQAIIPVPTNMSDSFWRQAAQNILAGVLLYAYELDRSDPNAFNHAMVLIQSKPFAELIDLLSESSNDSVAMFIKHLDIDYKEDSKMLAGIHAELSNHIISFATDNRIKAAFTPDPEADMIRWEDLETHNIYMQISEDKLGQWDSAITLMLTQLILTLERRTEKYSPDGQQKQLPPILLLLDEFPRLGKLDVIQNAISTLRSKGVTICLIIQSFAQLDKIYGAESRRIIVDNCSYTAVLNIADPETQQAISEKIGSVDVPKIAINFDGVKLKDLTNGDDLYMPSQNAFLGISMTQEPIIHPHDLAYVKKKFLLLTTERVFKVEKAPYYKETS